MMLLDGIHVPLTVPFYRDGALYLRKLEHNVRRLSLGPASALLALDPRLESQALSEAETLACLQSISETAAPGKVLVACVFKDSVQGALALIQQAKEARFDVVAVAAPPSWPALQKRSAGDETLNFMRAVADSSALPVMLWSDSAAPFFSFPVEMIGRLAAHPSIVGLYDADLTSERLQAIQQAAAGMQREAMVTHIFRPVTARMMAPATPTAAGGSTFVPAETLSSGSGTTAPFVPAIPAIKTRTKMLGFQVLSTGAASEMPSLLRSGASGAAPLLAAAAPQATHEAYAAHTDNDPRLSDEKAARLVEGDRLLAEAGPAGVKYAADITGFYGGWPRLPFAPLPAREQERIDRVMASLRN